MHDTEMTPKPPWKERKVQYLAHLREASAEVRLVSAADKVHNARAILADYRALGEALWNRFPQGKDEVLWYYGALVAIFRERGPRPLVNELRRVVDELEDLDAEVLIERFPSTPLSCFGL